MEDFSWGRAEGQLAVDIIETPSELIIRSILAGVLEKDLEIHATHDTVTIKGVRTEPFIPAHSVTHYAECFWGAFSRTIILPCSIQTNSPQAELNNGILTLVVKKAPPGGAVKITPTVV